ncbi:MAG: Rieske 2Fe-2S domain-containing protein [Celeribacter marinus]
MSAAVELCNSTQVVEGEIFKVEPVGAPAVALTRFEGKVFVFPDTCPHADESLSEGWVEDGRVICGVHFAEFELGSGKAHNEPVGCPSLSFFEFEERDGKVFANINEGNG